MHVDVLADRTETIRASVRDVQFTLLLTVALVVHGDVPVPAKTLDHRDHERGVAALAHRHVRHHVSRRIQPRQSLVDGADHLDRVRRR